METSFNWKLNLYNLGLMINSARVLSDILWTSTEISHLNLSHNWLGDEGIWILSSAIPYTKDLIHLDISSNWVISTGMNDLFWALWNNVSLISLDVSTWDFLEKNKITDDANEELCKLISGSNLIMYLYIGGTSLSTEAFDKLS